MISGIFFSNVNFHSLEILSMGGGGCITIMRRLASVIIRGVIDLMGWQLSAFGCVLPMNKQNNVFLVQNQTTWTKYIISEIIESANF